MVEIFPGRRFVAFSSPSTDVSTFDPKVAEGSSREIPVVENTWLGIWGNLKWRAQLIFSKYMVQQAQLGFYQVPDAFGEI